MRTRVKSRIVFSKGLWVLSLLTVSLVVFAATGEDYDKLDEAAVAARSGQVEQARETLQSLLADASMAVSWRSTAARRRMGLRSCLS